MLGAMLEACLLAAHNGLNACRTIHAGKLPGFLSLLGHSSSSISGFSAHFRGRKFISLNNSSRCSLEPFRTVLPAQLSDFTLPGIVFLFVKIRL